MAITKEILSEQLIQLETSQNSLSPKELAYRSKQLLLQLNSIPSWSDSRSELYASFLNLINDTEEYKPYLTALQIKQRCNELLIFAAANLSPNEIATLGLSAYAKVAPTSTTARLAQPHSDVFETIRELPDPLISETARRGGQVGKVISTIDKQLQPATSGLKAKLAESGVLHPAVAAICLSLIILMKNRLLATVICGGLVYLVYIRG